LGDNWEYKFANPNVTFEVDNELGETRKGIHLAVKTENGINDVWVPRKIGSIYRFLRNERTVILLEVPEWFASKTGLHNG
jgi:hypothetical protein